MTEPYDQDLVALATPYALHAMSEAEYQDVERQLDTAPRDVAEAFDHEVRAVREAMAVVSSATALEPPDALRDRLMAAIDANAPVRQLGSPRQQRRWRSTILSAAAALVVGLVVVGVGWTSGGSATPPCWS